jgi:hypothetical protein
MDYSLLPSIKGLHDLQIHNGAFIGHPILMAVVDQLIFYCALEKSEARPVIIAESEGCCEIVWTADPPRKLNAGELVQVSLGGGGFDQWTIQYSDTIHDYLLQEGGAK